MAPPLRTFPVNDAREFDTVVTAWAAGYEAQQTHVRIGEKDIPLGEVEAGLTAFAARTGLYAESTDTFFAMNPNKGSARHRKAWDQLRSTATVVFEGWKRLYAVTRTAQVESGQDFSPKELIGGRLLKRLGVLDGKVHRSSLRTMPSWGMASIEPVRMAIEDEVLSSGVMRTFDEEWAAVGARGSFQNTDETAADLAFEGLSRAPILPGVAADSARSQNAYSRYSGAVSVGRVSVGTSPMRWVAGITAFSAVVVVLAGGLVNVIGAQVRQDAAERRRDAARSTVDAVKDGKNNSVSLGRGPGGSYSLRVTKGPDGKMHLSGTVFTAIGPLNASSVRVEQPAGGAVESPNPVVPDLKVGEVVRVEVAQVGEDGTRYLPERPAYLAMLDTSLAGDPDCTTVVAMTVPGESNRTLRSRTSQIAGACLPDL